MRFNARVRNREGSHEVLLRRGVDEQSLAIAPGPGGLGSSASGGNCSSWRWQHVTAMIFTGKQENWVSRLRVSKWR